MKPVRTINPGEVGVRVNHLTGHIAQLHEGWALVVLYVILATFAYYE